MKRIVLSTRGWGLEVRVTDTEARTSATKTAMKATQIVFVGKAVLLCQTKIKSFAALSPQTFSASAIENLYLFFQFSAKANPLIPFPLTFLKTLLQDSYCLFKPVGLDQFHFHSSI